MRSACFLPTTSNMSASGGPYDDVKDGYSTWRSMTTSVEFCHQSALLYHHSANMSQTGTETQTKVVEAIFRYGEPDRSVTAEQRSRFAQPRLVNMKEEKVELHDYRLDTKLTKGVEGLHKHGFTLVENHLSDDAWSSEDVVRSTYMPSVEQLVKNVTGCKKAITNSVTFRRKHASRYDADKGFYHPAGGDFDRMIDGLRADRAMSTSIA